jgi:hypothetical protein
MDRSSSPFLATGISSFARVRNIAFAACWNLQGRRRVLLFMRVCRAECLILTIPLPLASGFAIMFAGKISADGTPSSSSPLTLHARIENDQTVFHVGEVIRLELSYSATGTGFQASTASYDRSGRLGIEQYVIEPQTGWDDPLKSYSSSGFIGGGFSSSQPLSAKPYIVRRDLNEWVRFTHAGRYRLIVVSTRAGRGEPRARST